MIQIGTELGIVLPSGSAAHGEVAAVAANLRDAMRESGRRTSILTPDGAALAGSCQTALWLPDARGTLPAADVVRRLGAAKHIALVVDPQAGSVSGYDGQVELLPALDGPRLPLMPIARTADPTKPPLVLVNTNVDFESEIERVLIQLTLVERPVRPVLWVPATDRATARAHACALRHRVDAYVVVGEGALLTVLPSLAAALGAFAWPALLLLAAARVPVAVRVDVHRPSLGARLVATEPSLALDSVLALAARIDRLLSRPAVLANDDSLASRLLGDAASLLGALDAVTAKGSIHDGGWLRIGPWADRGAPAAAVEAVPARPQEVADLDNALAALRARLAAEQGGEP